MTDGVPREARSGGEAAPPLPRPDRWLRRGSRWAFAYWASLRARRAAGRHVSVRYDADTDLFRVEDSSFGGQHRFAHVSRFGKYREGLERRARQMGEQYLLDRVPLAEGDTVVDVGANVGDLALYLELRGTPVHLIAFEPSPREFAALELNLAARSRLLSAEAHAVALWNADETRTLHLKSESADSSLLPVREPEGEVPVACRRLDGLLTGPRYRLLKLEAEGAEPEILEGAAGVIGRFDYIAADVGGERGPDAESTLPQAVNFLLARGFEILGIYTPRLCLLLRNTRADAEGPVKPPGRAPSAR